MPDTRPGGGGRPGSGGRPGGGGGDFIGVLPDQPGGGGRPGRPGQGGGGQQWQPGDNTRPSRPGQGGGGQQWRPGDNSRPDRPGQGDGGQQWRPGDNTRPSRPGQGGGGQQWRPDRPFDPDYRPGRPDRPVRPNRPDKWQNIHNNNKNQWNNWKQNNTVNINNFQNNRVNKWNNVNQFYNQGNWANRWGSNEYREWRENVWDFRKDRCEEIWDHREDFWDDVFDDHWWQSCWWRTRPAVGISVNTSPWWSWQPFAWASSATFFGNTVAQQPITYDPGTTVIYEGDNYYVNGQPSGSAVDARRAAIQLASPPIQEIPVPEPPVEGQPAEWLPMGVWALTQQEQGDATMFMQFSVDKNGILAGAYKNVMTGDEQPLVGQLDKKSQRLAWHVGDATQTVYETGLSSLENDVASVFVHFGEAQTQTWLLVRLPSPEVPPGTVKLPDLAKQ
jgi:hypothetical protein